MAVQRSRLTVAALRDRVRGDLGLRGSSFLLDEDLDFWAQESLDIIAREAMWNISSNTQNGVANQADYDLPADLLQILEVRYDNDPLWGITLRDLDLGYWDWRDADAGTPAYWYLRGTTSISLHPKPSANLTNGLVVHYVARPAVPTGHTDTYQIPASHETAILAYVKLQASLKDMSGEGAKRVGYYQALWEQERAKISDVAGQVGRRELVVGGDHGKRSLYPWSYNPWKTIPGP